MINWQLSKEGIRWPVSHGHIAGSGVDPLRSSIFKVIRWQVLIAGSSFFFFSKIHMKYVVFMSLWPSTIKILISNWLRKRKFSQFFLKVQAEKTFSYHGHALVALYFQFLYSDWSKFDRWVHAKKLCSILKIVYFDSWSWRVLCQLVMFLTVFFFWMYKMKYSCYQESSVIHGWFVYWVFGWEMRRLSKSEIRELRQWSDLASGLI